MPRRTAFAAFALSTALLAAAPAGAAQIRIGFDFSGSSLSILGGIIEVPPDGSISAGSGAVDVEAPDLTNVQPGAAALVDFELGASIDSNVGGQAHVTGDLLASQVSGGAASLTAGLAKLVFTSPVGIAINGNLGCAGAGCGFLGTFPLSIASLQTFVGSLDVFGANSPGNAAVFGTFDLSIGGFTAVLNLVGVEVSRTVVPEPASGALLALGLLALAGASRARRQR